METNNVKYHSMREYVKRLNELSPNLFTPMSAISYVQKMIDRNGRDSVERALFLDGVLK